MARRLRPAAGDVERLARLSLDQAVHSLTRPRSRRLAGPPARVDGAPLAPTDAWGHDVLWWMDHMVRSEAPLVERMTLVWHDWFATSGASVDARWMLRQNQLLRRRGLDSFPALFAAITSDPAMLLWLNGTDNTRSAPNENYAREAQELFALGAGRGYSEGDVRAIARAFTGFRADWSDGRGSHNSRYDPAQHDPGVKRIYGRRGRFSWRQACELIVTHRTHPSFLVEKLWGYFIPTAPSRATSRTLAQLYVRSGRHVRPLLEAILKHPALYDGPRMVKPPIVYTVGLLRASGRGIDDDVWSWVTDLTGQRPFYPPNVSGWDDSRWLDTSTWRGRWVAANYVVGDRALDPKSAYPPDEPPAGAVDAALAFWGGPGISPTTRAELEAYAQRCAAAAGGAKWKRQQYPVLRQNALRLLLATAPDLHTC